MLLDRIDIDAHGALPTVELGPFVEHLNVVQRPEGSGYSSIARLIRDSLVSGDGPLGMHSDVAGRVIWADRNGLIRYRRETDGTVTGRRTTEFLSRGGTLHRPGSLHNRGSLPDAWIHDPVGTAANAAHAIELPASISDGVITDVTITNVARVVSACLRSGLDVDHEVRTYPVSDDSIRRDRRFDWNSDLGQELAEVEFELARLGQVDADYETHVARQDRLTGRRTRSHRSRLGTDRSEGSHSTDWQQQLTRLHDRARQLRARQNELRRWIADLEADRSKPDNTTPTRSSRYQHRGAWSVKSFRRQLEDVDAQMIRWRRMLLDVRELCLAFESSHGYFATHTFAPLDEASIRRARLDGFLQAIDRYDRSSRWDDSYRETDRPLHRRDDIDHRIDSATRQIDWLLECYAGSNVSRGVWYDTSAAPAIYRSVHDRSGTTLTETLRVIREDLCQIHRYASRGLDPPAQRTAVELEGLRRCEQWLIAAIQRLNRHRDSLLHSEPASDRARTHHRAGDHHCDNHVFERERILEHERILERERGNRLAELQRITSELDACLNQAAEIRRSTRSLPIIDSLWRDDHDPNDWVDRDRFNAELRGENHRVHWQSHVQWLRRRRWQLLQQLRVIRRPVQTRSSLAAAASRWLARLSAGRLRRVDWTLTRFDQGAIAYARENHYQTGITINGRDETECSAGDRAWTAMAIRMAAGDLLARSGRPVPLVLETHPGMFAGFQRNGWREVGPHLVADPLNAAEAIATTLAEYSLPGRQVVLLTADHGVTEALSRMGARAFQIRGPMTADLCRPVERNREPLQRSSRPRAIRTTDDINRDFDMAGREAYSKDHRSNRTPPSPYFLTVDHTIDQAPSIDAAAAARLRGLSVLQISHLMQQDPNRLADALGLADVDASTIRRWQAECRLVCQVPQIRRFDARVLVGCGVTTPAQLASVDPFDLLRAVEMFLATERGQTILHSGSSQELARITSWLAAANRSHRDERRSRRRIVRTMNEPDAASNADRRVRASHSDNHAQNEDRRGARAARLVRRRVPRSTTTSQTPNRDVVRFERDHVSRSERRASESARAPRSSDDREDPSNQAQVSDTLPGQRFYLHFESPIVDAPSIGPRMGERLNAIGIHTVDDLLNADPETVASDLDHRRVDADRVLAWQQQATLVCQVPMLRGHDAQLLVAAEVTTLEALAESDPEELFGAVDSIARSNDGRRIVRGGTLPDLAEVSHWIQSAQQTGELRVA